MSTSSKSPCLECSPARERRDVPPLTRRATCRLALAMVCGATFSISVRAAEDLFDQIESALTWSAVDDRFRGRVSGTLDLEAYSFPQPAPMLLRARGHGLFTPRLSVFLDAQLGPQVYVFAQARVDRGFDPGIDSVRPRLDEYALRYAPWRDGRLNVQVGKFATVVGNWAARHGSWMNPFITAPLPYEYLTGIWDTEAIRSSNTLLQWSHVRPGLPAAVTANEKRLRIPVLWGPSYAIGASVSGELRRITYALEVKQSSLSSRPRAWHHVDDYRDHPTVSGRLGYRPSARWDFGMSASGGTYLRPFAGRSTAPGHGLGDYRQLVLGQDVSFAWRHLQVWTEIYATRFEIPRVANADTVAYYTEAKYRFTPRFAGALRWNQQLFATIPDRLGPVRWGHDVWRVDVAPNYRFTPHAQAKLQYSLQRGDGGARDFVQTWAGQLTLRF